MKMNGRTVEIFGGKIMSKIKFATSGGERFRIGMYAFGAILSYYIIYSYFQLFLTDAVGITPGIVSIIFAVAKVFDAVNDPVFGVIVDKYNPKGGKYTPWLKIASIAIPLTTILIFCNPVGASFPMWAKIAWALVSYILWDLAYTMYDAPLNSLIIVTSGSTDERNHLVALTSFMVYLGGLLIVILVPILYPMYGWLVTGIVIGALALLAMILMPFKAKERFNVETEKEASVGEILSCIVKNKYLLIIVAVQIIGSLTDFSTTLQTYFALYCLGGDTWLTPIALATVLPVLLVVFFIPKLLAKVDNFKAYIVTRIITVLITVAIYICGYDNVILLIALIALRAFVSSVWSMLGTLFIADCIEYGQYKTGERNQGVAFSLKAFVNKMVVALAGALGMLSLELIGYVEGGVAQTDAVVQGIWALYSLAPAVGSTIAIILFVLFYKLRDNDVHAMMACNRGEITKEECEARFTHKF